MVCRVLYEYYVNRENKGLGLGLGLGLCVCGENLEIYVEASVLHEYYY